MAYDFDYDEEDDPVEDTSMSRVSYVAEPPTDPSRARALQQATLEERTMGPERNAEVPSAPQTLPKLSLEQLAPQTAPIDRGPIPYVDLKRAFNAESEFDRLVREKLEGQHTDRAHFKSRVQNLADSHLAWQWQALDAVMGSGVALWEGLRNGGNRLLGTLPEIEAAATCKRVNQAKPIVIDLDDDEAEGAQPRRVESRDPGDEFSDLVASAAKEPIPARIPRAEPPSFTPQGREGLTVSEFAETALDAEAPSAKKTRPSDAKSCLAPSTAMTSSAASSLGALFAKKEDRSADEAPNGLASLKPVREDEESAAQEAPKPKQSSKAKSVLAQSTVMSSSAAGALGSLLAKSSARPPESAASTEPEAAPAPAASSGEPVPKKSSAAKSVLNQSTAMTSSAAGALGGLLAQGAAKAPPARTTPPPEESASSSTAPPPKKASGAKSVLNQSTAMTSSAAGALGGLLAQGAAKAPPTRTEPPATIPESAPAAAPAESPPAQQAPEATPPPKRSPDDRKSALATSTVMTSSAAATLGALAVPKAKAKASPAPASTQAAASSDTGAAAAAPKPKATRPKQESKTVISGLNTSSAASALLGPMVQAKK